MFTIETMVNGVAVRVAVTVVEAGLYKGVAVGCPEAEAYGKTVTEAVDKAALRASQSRYNLEDVA